MKKIITIVLTALILFQLGALMAIAASSPNGEEDVGKLYTFKGKLLYEDETWILQLPNKQKLKLGLPNDDFLLEEYDLKLVKFEFIEVTGFYDEDRFIVERVVKDGTAYDI